MSQGVNVLRYSALVFGVFYGISHQASLTAASKVAKEHHEYSHKESLISKAKEEFSKKKSPPSGVISNPDDPKFDLEKYLMSVAGEDKKA